MYVVTNTCEHVCDFLSILKISVGNQEKSNLLYPQVTNIWDSTMKSCEHKHYNGANITSYVNYYDNGNEYASTCICVYVLK